MTSLKSSVLAVGERTAASHNIRVVKELPSMVRFVLFCTEYGAEDITILRDGLAFLSTVCCISAISLNKMMHHNSFKFGVNTS